MDALKNEDSSDYDKEHSFYAAKAQLMRALVQRDSRVANGLIGRGLARDALATILPNLFLGSQMHERDFSLLQANGITHILQVGVELRCSHPAYFTYKQVPLYDLEEGDLLSLLPQCFEFIKQGQAAGKVLVHCMAGVSRSASVVIAYLMTALNKGLQEARDFVQAARPVINPNLGFTLQLRLYEEAGCSTEGWQPWTLDRFLEAKHRLDPGHATTA
mmetsp:Transcript_31333/g.69751  ORF Transcript_31333/g.69751 Transcript_31333/m.69751 type:complete len:217 (-) Transcript_31333:840-1490(-)|eukprot:CAMPEP_0202891284 /NCGR_PEP_ID=MMETSP1392-20130828/1382_1 /ASSEMBLY_ACC=CAM_ASM_000868 /TAXON_ID=225041 /ORGANISM="Chlamydomonas chlamydogama, Strain SAG 11-48b" /LENGTH=216 /DNA_ID=CAMNT_0049574987 /DNA_START=153 /DNA_END=803 /DNA_ORIENTATION=+